jgi:uncharacterized protein (UPF0332 family)
MKQDVQEHFQSADEFLKESEYLITGGFYRGAICRAYYAMFHAATAVLLERGIERSSHHGILAAFGQFIVKAGLVEPRFHTYFRKAFALRNECDYLSFTSAEEDQAKTTLERTKAFIEVCRKLCL